jgi:hypothetical protein
MRKRRDLGLSLYFPRIWLPSGKQLVMEALPQSRLFCVIVVQ